MLRTEETYSNLFHKAGLCSREWGFRPPLLTARGFQICGDLRTAGGRRNRHLCFGSSDWKAGGPISGCRRAVVPESRALPSLPRCRFPLPQLAVVHLCRGRGGCDAHGGFGGPLLPRGASRAYLGHPTHANTES